MTAPKRIQRKRTPGWRMPEGAIYVGRPSRWGNPWTIADCGSPELAVTSFRASMLAHPLNAVAARTELGGHDLACWCPLDQPCHADVLLQVANPS